MTELWPALRDALALLLSLDRDLWNIVLVSLSVSIRAIVFSAPIAILAAFVLAYVPFRGRQFVISLVHTWMALPAVVVGLVLYMLLSRRGPLGDLALLFTQDAMVIGQAILGLPIIIAMSHAVLQGSDRRAWQTALTLGASHTRAFLTTLREVRFGLLAAVVAAFSRVVAEVGCSMMVGGNILNHTRNIPTAIALETSKGAFVEGIALGIVLLVLALLLNMVLSWVRQRSLVRSASRLANVAR